MARLPIEFRKSSELQLTATLVDSLGGVAYIDFYCNASGNRAGTTTYVLLQDNTFERDSQKRYLTGSAEYSFDYAVENPFTIAGKEGYISYNQNAQANITMETCWVIARVDSGGTETEIFTASGANLSSAGGAAEDVFLVQDTFTETKFVKGDTLRVKANVLRTSGSNEARVYFGNPSVSITGSSGSVQANDIIVRVPVKLPT